jgi:hypothetical protein
MSDTPNHTSAKAEIQRLLAEADDETKKVIDQVVKLERGKLYQRNPNKSAIARDIAEIVRTAVQ